MGNQGLIWWLVFEVRLGQGQNKCVSNFKTIHINDVDSKQTHSVSMGIANRDQAPPVQRRTERRRRVWRRVLITCVTCGISVVIHSFLSIWILSYKGSKKTGTQENHGGFAPCRNFSEISTPSWKCHVREPGWVFSGVTLIRIVFAVLYDVIEMLQRVSPLAFTVYMSLHRSEFRGFFIANSEENDLHIVALCYMGGDCNFIHSNLDWLHILYML